MDSGTSKRSKLLKALRVKELSLMTGFSFAGIFFVDFRKLGNVALDIQVIGFVFVYVFAVYFLNSYSDYKEDSQSTRLIYVGLISKRGYLKLFVLCFVLFTTLAWSINPQVLVFGLSGLILWALYYLPPLRLKATIIWGTLVHLTAGIVHFNSTFVAFDLFSLDSFLPSVFFGALLSVGHLHHQIIDHEADTCAGISTAAVQLGVLPMVRLRIFGAVLVMFYWTVLFEFNYLTLEIFVPFLVASAILTVASVVYTKPQTALKFQRLVRVSFLMMGVVAIIAKMFKDLNFF
jgi:4-hydroxybenzoate polyprenyltransferase